jgi:hypothetical protein
MKTTASNGQSELMHELAGILRAPIQAINHRDPNIVNAKPISDPTFRESIKFRRHGLQLEVRYNGFISIFQCKIVLGAGVWSINQEDCIVLTRKSNITLTKFDRWPLFIAEKVYEKAAAIWHSDGLQQLLDNLQLTYGEGLHFYKNAVSFYSKDVVASNLMKRSDLLLSFLLSILPTSAVKTPRIVMPDPFHDLEDIAQKWAISDDTTRSEVVDKASKPELEKLVQIIMPRIDAINKFLAHRENAPASALGALAQAASEAKIALDAIKH